MPQSLGQILAKGPIFIQSTIKNGFHIFKWLKKSNEEYLMTCGNYVKLNINVHKIMDYQNTASRLCLGIIYGCFHS